MAEFSNLSDESSSQILALFFTYRVSMRSWKESGIVNRELAVYEELLSDFDQIYIFTYGEDDAEFNKDIHNNISVVSKSHISNPLLYSILIPIIHYRILSDVNIIKTNQMAGAWTAVLSSVLHRTHLVIRTGYVWSKFAKQGDEPKFSFVKKYTIERIVYLFSDVIITTSAQGFLYIEKHHWPLGRHVIIPNYVDTNAFVPTNHNKSVESLCYVGRLDQQKNMRGLVKSMKELDLPLTIIGYGPLYDDLKELAQANNLSVGFPGKIPNSELPEKLNQHEVFVLPSHYEGMPKSLIEAMACGLPVVATEVPGNREVVDNMIDGILCDTTPESIRDAIIRIQKGTDQYRAFGDAAREKAVTHYSLEQIAKEERKLYANLTAR